MARDDATKAMISFRIPERVRAKLEARAELSRWSMTNEVVRRLDRSLEQEEAEGGAHTAALLRMIAGSVQLIETMTGKTWVDDEATRDACIAAVVRTFQTYKDPAPGETPEELAAYVPLMRLREDAAQTIGAATVAALNSGVAAALKFMQQADEAIAAGKRAGKLKLAATLDGFPLQELERDRKSYGAPQRSELELEILKWAAAASVFTYPSEPKWQESILEWARTYPGGLEAARDAMRAHADRDRSLDEPGALEAWISSQTVPANGQGD